MAQTPPAEAAERILKREAGRYDLAVCDIHAEATSEKLFFARYFDGKFSAVWGTHTHVPTADICILPGGTGYITDIGMTGPINSCLGVRTELSIEKMRTKLPVRFATAEGPCAMDGVLFTLDDTTGKCTAVKRIRV